MTPTQPPESMRAGIAALSSYTIWGLSPIFYKLLGFASATEIVLHRALWSVPTLLLVIWAGKNWTAVVNALTKPKVVGLLLVTAVLIAANWWTFIFAVNEGRVLEVSLGYFINPLMNVAVGLLVFREKLGPWRIAAIALALIGVANQIVSVGHLPLLALFLAVTFTAYGYIRKTIAVDSRVGMLVETVIIAIPSMIALGFVTAQGQGHFNDGWWPATLLILTGPMTVAPLLLFIVGARGLNMATLGILQFIAPSLQFACAVAYGEAFTPAHAVTFGFIWAGLACFTVSMLRRSKKEVAA